MKKANKSKKFIALLLILSLFLCTGRNGVICVSADAEAVSTDPVYVTSSGAHLYNHNGFLYKLSRKNEDTEERIAWVYGYIGDEERVIVPNTLGGCRVTIVSLANNSLFTAKSITLPNSVTRLIDGNFSVSSLEEVILPDSIEYIDRDAFGICPSLRTIRFPDNELDLDFRWIINASTPAVEKIIVPEKIERITWAKPNIEMVLESEYMKRFVKTFKSNSPEVEQWAYAVAYKPVSLRLTGTYCNKEAAQMLKEINQKRKKRGWSALKMNKQLLQSAKYLAMHRAVLKNVASNGNKYSYAAVINSLDARETEDGVVYEIPMNKANVESTYAYTRAGLIRELTEPSLDANNPKYKSAGIGVVRANGKKYYYLCAGMKNSGYKSSKKYKDEKITNITYLASLAVKKLKAKDVTVGRGKSSKLTIKVRPTKKFCPKKEVEKGYQYFDSAGKMKMSELKFKSLNPSVAKVNSKGKVTGLKRGTAKIKVSLKCDPSKSVKVKVTVR